MWRIYAMEFYLAIKKNEILPFAATWMDLENIILSEVSQRKTNTLCYHLYVESKKNNTNKSIYKTETDLDIGKKLVVTEVGREGRRDELGVQD